MFLITNLIKSRIGKLIFNHLIGNNCLEFCNGFLGSYFFKLTLGSDCLELCFPGSCFQNHPDSVISEAVARRCSVKKVFLEISQNSQESTCARVSFLIKLQASAKFLRTPFLTEHLRWLPL